MSQVEDKLKEMGYTLPTPPVPGGNYIPAYRTGNLVFLAGVTPRRQDGSMIVGKVGRDMTVEQGYEAQNSVNFADVILMGDSTTNDIWLLDEGSYKQGDDPQIFPCLGRHSTFLLTWSSNKTGAVKWSFASRRLKAS